MKLELSWSFVNEKNSGQTLLRTWPHFVVLLKSDIMFQKLDSESGLMNESSSLAGALCVSKILYKCCSELGYILLCCLSLTLSSKNWPKKMVY